MTLTIHPDPQEPAGGYAFLELPDGTLGEGPVNVAVMEVYGNRWLVPSKAGPGASVTIGAASWQPERHDFGPYDVHRHDGADWVRIGPEIVNKIDEYTPLRLSVGDQVADVTWPDDVPPRAGAAVLGGLQTTARSPADQASENLVGKRPDPEPVPDPVPAPKPPISVLPPVEEPSPLPQRRSMVWLIVLILLLLAGAIALWWWWNQAPPVNTDDPVLATDTCTLAALQALDGFPAIATSIRACGDALSPDVVLKLIEDAAEQGDPEALLLFGTLYDGAQIDARIEQVIGLSFDHDATKAVEYYARAVAAGSGVAGTRLTASCAQLAGSNETLAKGAYDDFCR